MNQKNKNRIRAASFEDTFVIGINSGLVDYKLAWMINKKFSIDLVREDDISADGVSFSFYYYTSGENSPIYNLVSILSQDQCLLDFKPRLDYLMVMRNGIMAQRVDAIVKGLREMEGVGHALLIDSNKGVSIRQALEIIELQEIDLLKESNRRNTIEYVRQELIRKRNAYTPKENLFTKTY